MAKNKAPKIEIRQRKGSQGIMTGSNTEILIDGKKMGSATKVTFEVAANATAKVNVELLGRVAVSGKIGKYSKTVTKIQTE
jgi:hypothetical protein